MSDPVDNQEQPATPSPEKAQREPATPPPVVEFRNVTKTFGTGAKAKPALQDVTFVVHDLPNQGELITIVGPSGCGKSTLLRIIAGLEPHFPPTQGTALVAGKPIEGPAIERGLVDQKYSLLPHLTVLENIGFGLKLQGVSRSDRRDRSIEWLKKVGLEGCEDKYPSQLSGGMQQRVAIAATLILGPRILLMDEPFGALDPRIRLRMQELLIQLWREEQGTVFLVTHSVEEAIYVGDRVYRMGASPGRLVEELKIPRPDVPPEQFREQSWFAELTVDLRRRLEKDAPASGAFSRSPAKS